MASPSNFHALKGFECRQDQLQRQREMVQTKPCAVDYTRFEIDEESRTNLLMNQNNCETCDDACR